MLATTAKVTVVTKSSSLKSHLCALLQVQLNNGSHFIYAKITNKHQKHNNTTKPGK